MERPPTYTPNVSRRVNTGDLIDAVEVAAILGLAHRSSVTTYLRRYPNFPSPVVDKGHSRTRLWVRQDIEKWATRRSG